MCGFAVYTGGDKKLKLDIAHEFEKIQYRGPDNTIIRDFGEEGWMGFHRLKIMDLSDAGNQPLTHNNIHLVCNGEVYNFRELKKKYETGFEFQSESDCEVMLPLFLEKGIVGMAKELDAEYVCVIYDDIQKKYFAARDPIGIRPMFYGYDESGEICFASEMKSLHKICDKVYPFPPGYCYDGEKLVQYEDISKVEKFHTDEQEEIFKNINDLFTKAVEKRMDADAPVGFLCSGGLDSSLVCAIAARLTDKPIKTFAVGIEDGPIDTKYARIVADYLKTDHTEVLFSRQEIFDSLSTLIYNTETWDITTIRASMGMYILCKYIHEKTDVKVLLTGEISDEIFGYKYTDFAPTPDAFQKEAEKRIREIYMYDVLRADRCISSNGLEARVPFGDLDFVKYVMAISPEKKMNFTGIGKYLLRKAFEDNYLPHDILYREKAAFSDAVGHSVVDYLKAYAEEMYSDEDLELAQKKFTHAPPISKESLMYREIYEGHFPGRADLIKDFWMPNKEWEHCNVNDPSARILPNYGKSGE
ncbi:asparagine synthase B [Alkalitalea saponilacus]|uniref:asparagine synthase (glutamine-hydrolyzing) n=1 Tax=Alkalitalea saponilacus TaxID=889453 RepID=A0A1T5BGT8_9BACT|nr:asparagine synthase B [Alkalitalea saponilacus]ASB49690.1 asparagine synthase B [Alkalitalea saponilacus]SKB46511.1 asparagine synthase (glutamine-hydrolysing) [Alkalitalea saponilacus]